MSQSHGTLRLAPAVQRALGRTGGAAPSAMARPWPARPAPTVAPLRRGSWSSLKRDGQPPPHRGAERLWGGDVEVTPLPIGAHAEGSERPWLGRTRSKTGRTVGRWPARAYRAMLPATWWRGQASAGPALQTARGEVAIRRGGTRERRQRMVLRLDGGWGPTAVLHWVRSRDSQVVAQSSPRGRGRKRRQALGPWPPPASPGREIAAVLKPHRCCRTTRQWGMRTPQDKGGDHSAIGGTTVPDLAPGARADAYDGRARMEARFCQDKQAWGLVTRRQRQGAAQPLGLLLARLAHHLLLWGQQGLSRVPATRRRLQGSG